MEPNKHLEGTINKFYKDRQIILDEIEAIEEKRRRLPLWRWIKAFELRYRIDQLFKKLDNMEVNIYY